MGPLGVDTYTIAAIEILSLHPIVNIMQNLTESLKQTQQVMNDAVVAASRPVGSVTLLAVSKKQAAEAIRQVYDLGQTAFGENYVQEALEKQQFLANLEIQWHFIGPIQSNKTRQIAEHFDWVHSVDRLKVAERLSRQRPQHLPPLNICLQVNIDNEPTKSGFSPQELLEHCQSIAALPQLTLRGVMAIPAPSQDYAEQLAVFKRVQDLYTQLQSAVPTVDTLSMGMSGDMQAAINAGSTMVRVGTGIFGARD